VLRVFSKPDSKYLTATTTTPDNETDKILARFAAAIEEGEREDPTEETARAFPMMNFRQRIHMPSKKDELFENAVRAWDRATEEYEPTEDELVAEDQLRMFCERGGV